MRDLVICGAGGFADEVTCLVNRINAITPKWNFIGYIDKDMSTKGGKRRYGTILGDISFVNNSKKPLSVAVAIGNPARVKKVISEVHNEFVDFPNVIDPDVLFLDKETIRIGQGNIICANCVVSCNVDIGDFNILNIGAGVGHDAIVGNYNVIMPNVNISGGVIIGECNLLGVKSTVIQYLKIGKGVTLGANSVLMRSAKDDLLYIGNPAKKMEL